MQSNPVDAEGTPAVVRAWRVARYALALLVAASWLVPARDGAAANYLVLRSGIDEVVMIDRDSISRDKARAQAWVVRRFEKPVGSIIEIRERYVFDCAARTLGVAERRGGEDASAPISALAAPPSGLEQTLIALACGG